MFHIVDDNQFLGDALADLVQGFGYEVLLFTCPIEYLNYMDEAEYATPVAILSDVKMPRLNGYDFIQQVRAINPLQKFMAMTATPELEHDYKHLACMYLCKPFPFDQLKTALVELMQCHQSSCLNCDKNFDNKDKFDMNVWSCPNRNKHDSSD